MMSKHACREIVFSDWKRARHYELFAKMDYPFIGVTTELDISEWDMARHRSGRKFFPAFLHSVILAMNAIENFRYRIERGKVLLYEKVDSSFVVFDANEELFYFATVEMTENADEFDCKVEEAKKLALAKRSLDNNRSDIVYTSSSPWFGFTDVIQPLGLSRPDSIPRVIWGRIKRNGDIVSLPFSLTGHHGLIDGFHIGRLLKMITEA
jgi:chloramphenicol O-acetyltransferase type A